MVEISEDLKEIVSTTIESIKEGMKGKGTGVVGPIEFELAVVKSKGAKGGLRFFLADASACMHAQRVDLYSCIRVLEYPQIGEDFSFKPSQAREMRICAC